MYEYDDLNETYIHDPDADFGWIEPNGLKVPGSPDDKMHGDVLGSQLGRENRKLVQRGRRWIDVGGTTNRYGSGYNPGTMNVPDFAGAFKEGHVRYVNSPKHGIDMSFARHPKAAENAIKFLHDNHVGQKIHIDVMDDFSNATHRVKNPAHHRGKDAKQAEQWIKSQVYGQEFHPSAVAQYREEGMREVEYSINAILCGVSVREMAESLIEDIPVAGTFQKGQQVTIKTNIPTHHPEKSGEQASPGDDATASGVVVGDTEDGRLKVAITNHTGQQEIVTVFPDAVVSDK